MRCFKLTRRLKLDQACHVSFITNEEAATYYAQQMDDCLKAKWCWAAVPKNKISEVTGAGDDTYQYI